MSKIITHIIIKLVFIDSSQLQCIMNGLIGQLALLLVDPPKQSDQEVEHVSKDLGAPKSKKKHVEDKSAQVSDFCVLCATAETLNADNP